MKTEELIRALANDNGRSAPSLAQAIVFALVVGLAVAAAEFWMLLGPRPDFAAALQEPRFLLKFAVTLALAASAVALTLRLARPGADPRALGIVVWTGPILLLLAVAYELSAVPSSQWGELLVGSNATVCLLSIPLIAAPLLVALILALKRGAPVRPALAGAVAGLAAGGFSAALYAAHCVDDSPLFVMAWYVPAIVLVAAIGALAGERLLRW